MLGVGLLGLSRSDAQEQVAQVVTNTPVRVNIPTSAPPATAGLSPTPILPTFTPTPLGAPQLQVPVDAQQDVNVRAEPDIDAQILGTIRPGDTYPITGRYFRWLQFRFDPSPTRIGYVYDELVTINGDETRIPDLAQAGLATQDIAVLSATETADAIRQTPGFELTMTANALFVEAPSGGLSVQPEVTNEVGGVMEVLPTFTYPPNIVAQAPTRGANVVVTSEEEPGIALDVSDGVAPIVPIVVLAALGLIGLLLSLIRR